MDYRVLYQGPLDLTERHANVGATVSDFGDMTRRTCRLIHKCEWCGEQIERGARAWYYAGRWQGEWQSWYMHDECYTAYQQSNDGYDEGFYPFENERGKAGQ